MSQTKLELGAFIREKRVGAHMTLTNLAEIASTNKKVIQEIEKGRGWHTKQKFLHVILALNLAKEERKRALNLVGQLCGTQKTKRSAKDIVIKKTACRR